MKVKTLLLAVLLVSALTAQPCGAAQWGEGLGPEKPYSGVPEVNLTKTMGYIMLYPRIKMPGETFCDVLEMYLPREDVERGSGELRLYDEEDTLINTSHFENEDEVEIRSLSEEELTGLMWGGGICITAHLPVSLELGKTYYVLMDEGCFTAADGAVKNLPVKKRDAWQPVVNGDFGVENLSYRVTPDSAADGAPDGPAPAESEAAAAPDTAEITLSPKAGDTLVFDVVIGGDCVTAVAFSDDGTVTFDEIEFTSSGRAAGHITGENGFTWGVVFLNADGDVLDVLSANK